MIRSDGSPERDFLYAEDAARAYVAIAEPLAERRGGGEAFNAGGGRPNAVGEVVELICELAGTGVEPDFRGEGNPEGEIDRQSWTGQDPRGSRAGSPRWTCARASADARLVPRAPRHSRASGRGAGLRGRSGKPKRARQDSNL